MTQGNHGDHVVEAWNQHRPYLVDLAFRILGDIGTAEDVVQTRSRGCWPPGRARSRTSAAG
jgi:hypothetical protein